ncbi:MAG: anti-sigma factor antagonist [bacterium]|nr:MAG: anti-sigma factor antagonist [bacterium]
MKISKDTFDNDVELVRLDGRLDVHSTPIVLEMFENMIHDSVIKVILDMSKVEFISSYGLGMLVTTLKNIEDKGGSLKLASLQPEIKAPMEVTGILSRFEVFSNAEEALGSFA